MLIPYRVLLTAETPVSFRTGRATSDTTTHPYIPGSSLLGGLAQAHQLLGRPPDEFSAFFLHNRVLLSNGYPANFDTRLHELQGHTRVVLPLPVTARTCKRTGGFCFGSDRDGTYRTGVTDGLSGLALFALSEEKQPSVLTHLRIHPKTAHPLDRIEGFFRQGQQNTQLGQPQIPYALRTHVGINYGTGTAQTSILYNRQVLQAGSVFWGCWWIDETLAPSFESFIETATDAGLIRVGTNRTRGLGRMTCNLARYRQDTIDHLRKRVEDFTQHFKQAAQTAEIAAPDELYVPLLLESDVIVYDDLLRHRLQLNATDLAPFGIPDAQLVYHAATWRAIKGWSVYWGLPKADEWVISKGAVFLFAIPKMHESIFTGLLRLQQEGLGRRRAEGFGIIRVAHQFHTTLFGNAQQGGVYQ